MRAHCRRKLKPHAAHTGSQLLPQAVGSQRDMHPVLRRFDRRESIVVAEPRHARKLIGRGGTETTGNHYMCLGEHIGDDFCVTAATEKNNGPVVHQRVRNRFVLARLSTTAGVADWSSPVTSSMMLARSPILPRSSRKTAGS